MSEDSDGFPFCDSVYLLEGEYASGRVVDHQCDAHPASIGILRDEGFTLEYLGRERLMEGQRPDLCSVYPFDDVSGVVVCKSRIFESIVFLNFCRLDFAIGFREAGWWAIDSYCHRNVEAWRELRKTAGLDVGRHFVI